MPVDKDYFGNIKSGKEAEWKQKKRRKYSFGQI